MVPHSAKIMTDCWDHPKHVTLPSVISFKCFNLIQVVGREEAVLAVGAEHPGGAVAARHATVRDAVEQGAAAEAVVAVHAARDLASGVEALDRRIARAHNLALRRDLETTHAVVDGRRHDRDVVLVIDHRRKVVEELLAPHVVGLAGRVRVVLATVRVRHLLLAKRSVILEGRLEHALLDAHLLAQVAGRRVVLHDATALVVLAVPVDLRRRLLVQAEAERRLVLPHAAGHVVAAPELVREALALTIDEHTANTTESLGRQELHLGVGIVRLHKTRRVHLHPLQVDRLRADALTHLDAITSAVLAVRGREVEQVRAVLREVSVRREIGAEASRAHDDRAVLLVGHACLLVLAANDRLAVAEEAEHPRLVDDASAVRGLRNLLEALHERVRDRHPREALSATVRALLRVTAETSNQRQVEVELLDEPLNARAGLVAHHLRNLRLLRATLERVSQEDLTAVDDALLLLRRSARAVDAGRSLRGVAAAEGRLVEDDTAPAVLQDRVGCGEARKITANDNALVCRENLRHLKQETKSQLE